LPDFIKKFRGKDSSPRFPYLLFLSFEKRGAIFL
jgi:hypothetical protein